MVILLGSLTAMGPLAIDMYLSSLPAIGRSLAVGPAQTQATVAAFLAGMSIGQMFYGPASDRFGRRAPVLLGVAIFILASAGCALATSIDQLLIGRFVQALGACAGAVVARAVVRDRFDHTETARMLSLMMLIMGLAPILAPLLGAALLTVGGWRLNFWFMAAFGLAVGGAVVLRLSESRSAATARQAAAENPFQAYLALMRARRLVGYAMAGSLNGAALFTYIASAPGLLMGKYGVPVAVFPWLFGLNAVGIIGGNQVNRFLLRRFTTDQVLARASVVALAFGLALTLAAFTGIAGRWSVLPLLFCVMASLGFMQGNTMAGALSVDPLRAGSVSALLGAASFGTGALASTLAGALHGDPAQSMSLVMMLSLAGSAIFLHALALPKRA
ncbi:MAG: multidrug effflux MFS transporter [Caulobacterales bacterium]|nr:multidrug effflux MFS transporter [Caulobacterales bacterium]